MPSFSISIMKLTEGWACFKVLRCFVSRKIGQDLKECETKPQLVNKQCVVCQFKCKGAMLVTRAGIYMPSRMAIKARHLSLRTSLAVSKFSRNA